MCASIWVKYDHIPKPTSHALKPLDVSCFKPFKQHFKKKKPIIIQNETKSHWLGKKNIGLNIFQT